MARSVRANGGEYRNHKLSWDFSCSPVIGEFMRDKSFIRGIMGPVGSGKSTACVSEILKQAMSIGASADGIRRSRFVVIRNTYGQLRDTTIQTWLQNIPEEIFGPFHWQDMAHYVNLGDNVRFEVLFRALDKPEDIRKLLSLEVTGAWINEAREIDFSILQALEARVGRYPRHREVVDYFKFIVMDTNPPDTEHWWYKLSEQFCPRIEEIKRTEFLTPQDALKTIMQASGGVFDFKNIPDEEAKDRFDEVVSKYKFFRQPSGLSQHGENKTNLDPAYYYRIAMGKNPEWVNIYVHGEYGVIFDGKAVYPEYEDSFHYKSDILGPDKGNKIILRGWDGGRTPACIFVQMDPRGNVMAFDELTSQDTGLSEFADIVNRHCAVYYPDYKFQDFGDPSIFHKSQLEDRAPSVILAAKGINLQAGIQAPTIRKESVRKILRERRPIFAIGPKCVMLRKGLMGGYQYKRKMVTGEKYHETPDKNEFSHPVEAFEYICTRLRGESVMTDELTIHDDDDLFETRSNRFDNTGASSITGY